METTNVAGERLMRDLKTVVGDTQELIKATAGDAREQVAGARTRAEESLRQARARVVEIEKDVAARTRAAAQATNAYVHENPWPSIGLAAGSGFVIGLLMRRRRKSEH